MNIKKEVHVNVVKRLEKEQRLVRDALYLNKCEMKKLVEKQTIMKRELVVLHDLIKSLG